MHPSWKPLLQAELQKDYMQSLKAFLQSEADKGRVIYPPLFKIFAAFEETSFEDTKVVILGQDPYHGPGQAHGLCFSVSESVPPPPSLKNIFKELHADVGAAIPKQGNLTAWSRQGVLLLNSVLSVEHRKPGSHVGKGWEHFTDFVVSLLNQKKEGLVFILWGSYAIKKGQHIDRDKHLVLSSAHPSPFSAHRGFLGSRPFSKANTYLVQKGKESISWSL